MNKATDAVKKELLRIFSTHDFEKWYAGPFVDSLGDSETPLDKSAKKYLDKICQQLVIAGRSTLF
jgi:hypothetical protein